jgi:hypothetical protein
MKCFHGVRYPKIRISPVFRFFPPTSDRRLWTLTSLNTPIGTQVCISAFFVLLLIISLSCSVWILALLFFVNLILGNILNMKLYLFILWTRAKYKKSIFYF